MEKYTVCEKDEDTGFMVTGFLSELNNVNVKIELQSTYYPGFLTIMVTTQVTESYLMDWESGGVRGKNTVFRDDLQ